MGDHDFLDLHGPHRDSRDRSSGVDELTTLPSHSTFLDELARLRTQCRQSGETLSILLFDLDRFRDCNERYSPAFADNVLRWFASIVQRVSRPPATLARYQSDSFITAHPGLRAADAVAITRRCRELMFHEPLRGDGHTHEISVSVGIVESTIGFIETEQQLIHRARIALDHAKHHGGNRTFTWSEMVDSQPLRRDPHHLSTDGVSHWMERLREQLRTTYLESTRALVAAVEAKDPHTQAHAHSVAAYAEAIGGHMRVPVRLLTTLRAAALLHDIGKIGIPDAILTKPGPLTAEEYDVVKRHPATALEILGHVSFLADERPIILHHHERYDGAGYPSGLAGDRIPVGARILAVADALDAMFSTRSYKPSYDLEHVRSEIRGGAGRQFDPEISSVTLEWLACTPQSTAASAV